MTNKEQLIDLIGHRTEAIPVIKDILAESGISDKAYAQIFKLIYFDLAESQEHEISFCKSTKEWRIGKKPLSDLRLFCLLGKVHEIVWSFVLSSWDECIFSSWISEMPALEKAKTDMTAMETMPHLRGILKIAIENMAFKSDSRVDWGSDTDVDEPSDSD